MNIAEQVTQLKADFDEVKQAGRQEENDSSWDVVQRNGNRTDYGRAFRFWDMEHISPKHKVTGAGALNYLFCDCAKLKTFDLEKFDFSNMKPTFANTEDAYAMFCRCAELEHLPDLGIPACSVSWMFAMCKNLRWIDILRLSEQSKVTDTFASCFALEELTIEGSIGQNGLNLKDSTKLSKRSLTSVVNALSSDTSNLTATLSKTAVINAFGSTEADEWIALIATKSNWTISLV